MLTDEQIRHAAEDFGLITGAYDSDSAKYASYEVHASAVVEKLIYDGEYTGHVEYGVSDNEIVIEPGATLKIYTAEHLNLPPYLYAEVIVLGQLFSSGIAAGNTYVDPGSTGPIYLSMTNVSPRALRIPIGEPIGRAQFYTLQRPVLRAHPGPQARRELRLRVNRRRTRRPDENENEALERLASSLLLHKIAMYLASATFLGLWWASQSRDTSNAILDALIGDSLPRLARLIIPLIVGSAIAFAFHDFRTALWTLVMRGRRRDE
ncbi:hypothetical protein MXD63_04145 [Frankia sp. Cpl3]|nr:hypothetical protein [Frankia sp. Cpl3]